MSTRTRRALLAALLGGATAAATTGCSNTGMPLAGMMPFKPKAPAVAPATGAAGSVGQTLADSAAKSTNQLAAFGGKAKDAVFRTTGSVTNLFSRSKAEANGEVLAQDDPLRLDNKPDKVDAEVYVANGQLWESTGNPAKAMESYSKALSQEPNHVAALTSIARLHYRQNNHPQAAVYFQKAIEQQANDPELYHDLGLTLSKLGNQSAAVQTLSRALQLSPGNSRYANVLATVQFEAGSADQAFQTLSQNNKPAVAHFNMAYLHYKGGQMDRAKTHLHEALRFAPVAASDDAIRQAVERSQKMLAQIDGGEMKIARAEPTPAPASTRAPASTPATAAVPAAQPVGQTHAVQSGIGYPGVAPTATTSPAPSTPPTYSLPSAFSMPSGSQ